MLPPEPPTASSPFDVDKPDVDGFVSRFSTRGRGFFDRALWRGSRYMTSMTDILTREGLPTELAYLPLIESGYQPHAVSRAGATGPWQFIHATGRRYGLRIDSMVDERRDPIKSTEAAVRYLKDLHTMFGDWELSLAAYNVGEYRVAQLLERKGVDDYWGLRRYLPRETSEYVPRFLAAVKIAQSPGDYGFVPPAPLQLQYETVRVDRDLSLRTASALAGVPQEQLAALNPALKRAITPRGYELRVPHGSAEPLLAGLARYASRPLDGSKFAKDATCSRASC
jgi:membrane-bound lytic murein transglycosylase D